MIRLASGDRLLLYTDGVSEAASKDEIAAAVHQLDVGPVVRESHD